MELLMEILFEVYSELMLLIVPEKSDSKAFTIFSKLIAIVMIIVVIALGIWGFVLINDYNNLHGYIFIAIAAVISLVQIVLGIVFYIRNTQ